jgi:hypothetical protein
MAIRYVKHDTAPLETQNGEPIMELLWGDQVRADAFPVSGRVEVLARGATGWVDTKVLGTTPLLELYFMDVGQGDGVLVRFPDGRYVLIDERHERAVQTTNYSADAFVDSKSGYLIRLMADEADAAFRLNGSGGTKLQDEWAQFIGGLIDRGDPGQWLRCLDAYLPGFDPSSGSDVQVRVLGPVEFDRHGKPLLRSPGAKGQNTNGHSSLLRFDFGNVRILLTGDLNKTSQAALLEACAGTEGSSRVDLMNGRGQGSGGCSHPFLEHVHAACTVISSGDDPTHGSLRPEPTTTPSGDIVASSDDAPALPIHSTGISRNVPRPRLEVTDQGATARASKREVSRNPLLVVPGVERGLVNVRTDGAKVLCATMNEKNGGWAVRTFEGRSRPARIE